MRLRGYVATWLRGYVATRLRGYAATRLCGYAATQLCGYVATRLRGYVATRLRGYAAMTFCVPVGRSVHSVTQKFVASSKPQVTTDELLNSPSNFPCVCL